MSVFLAVLAILVGLWATYRAGRARTAYAQYARGYMDGYNVGCGDGAHIEGQRENAPWQ